MYFSEGAALKLTESLLWLSYGIKSMSREVVTYGIQFLEHSEHPDWRPLDREDKEALVTEVMLSPGLRP